MASNIISLEWHRDALVVIATGGVESLKWEIVEAAADIVLDPIRDQKAPLVVFDLGQVNYFGSVFMALLVRCHKQVRIRGGVMVLCAVHPLVRDLLHTTALDTLWAIYDTQEEALEAIGA
ncbi:STAS domain-containing protein [Planctomicrobium sp. SH527]|uniref:STAS domain-containing protein n=1 Tax=Planctomicrobium sp. SH527 TaxID=3448123 RepID=UPI003F5CB9FC